MDPLSWTASIIAVLQLTATLTSYISEARNVTVEQVKVAVNFADTDIRLEIASFSGAIKPNLPLVLTAYNPRRIMKLQAHSLPLW
jgi:hypothetical protein